MNKQPSKRTQPALNTYRQSRKLLGISMLAGAVLMPSAVIAKNSQHGHAYMDAHKTYMQYTNAVLTGKPLSAYQHYFTANYKQQTDKEMADFSVAQREDLNRMVISCEKPKIVRTHASKQQVKITYAITNPCESNSSAIFGYKDVVFNYHNGWKIDSITDKTP